MSFLWWWNRKSSEPEEDVYCIDHAVLSSEQFSSLSELPFAYKPDKVWLFICKSTAFPFVSVISDLDYQFLHHLAHRLPDSVVLYYNDVSLAEIIDCSVFTDETEDIESFFNLFKIDGEAYNGVGDVQFWEFIEKLDFIEQVNKKVEQEINNVYDGVQEHYDALYGNSTLKLQ